MAGDPDRAPRVPYLGSPPVARDPRCDDGAVGEGGRLDHRFALDDLGGGVGCWRSIHIHWIPP